MERKRATDHFFDLPALARTRRTFLGETFSTFATRETFLPCFSHTMGITSSANSSEFLKSLAIGDALGPCAQPGIHAATRGDSLLEHLQFMGYIFVLGQAHKPSG